MNALRQGEAESEREAGRKMVKVSVEVRSDTACFRIGVLAESIRGALAMVGRSYPRGKISVVFPIEPEDFFVSVPSSPADLVRFERTQREAA